MPSGFPDVVCSLSALSCQKLEVPLKEPFTVATAQMTVTQSVLVEVSLRTPGGVVTGIGESGSFHPITREDRDEVLRVLGKDVGQPVFESLEEIEQWAEKTWPQNPVARCGAEVAVLDALSRSAGLPLATWATGSALRYEPIESDMTIPIVSEERAAELAVLHKAEGFRKLKLKVGKDLKHDLRVLKAVSEAVPGLQLSADANAGYSEADALAFLKGAEALKVSLENFEQPTARENPDGLKRVTERAGHVPVVADESCRSFDDLRLLVERRAVHAINLKLCKTGGWLKALEMARFAKSEGLKIMLGAMVDTRLGIAAMCQLAWALGGVDFADLDTAFLLDGDPFQGGYDAQGAVLHAISGTVGHGVSFA